EWAWLLYRYDRLTGRTPDRFAPAIIEFAERFGIDRERGVAINEVWSDGRAKDRHARLWPQTERLKAAISHREHAPATDRPAIDRRLAHAVNAIFHYCDAPVPGLFHDRLTPEGTF